MQMTFDFRIKEVGVRRWHTVTASVDVPDNWESMDAWDQENYLTRPNGYSPNYHGVVSFANSRFENVCQSANIFGVVSDFTFAPSNKASTRRGAGVAISSNDLGFAPRG